jgi:hypothetical protein
MNDDAADYHVDDATGNHDGAVDSSFTSFMNFPQSTTLGPANCDDSFQIGDSAGRRIKVLDHADFDFCNAGGTADTPFSISGWFSFHHRGSTDQVIISKENCWSLAVTSSDKLYMSLQDDSAFTDDKITRYSNALTTETWYHVCITYDGTGTLTGLKMYINGSLETNDTDSVEGTNYVAMEPLANDIYIGAKWRVYNVVITDTIYQNIQNILSTLYSSGAGTETTTYNYNKTETTGCSWTDGATLGRALQFDGSARAYVNLGDLSSRWYLYIH